MKYWLYISLIIGGVLLTCGDLWMKAWAVSDKKLWYVIGVATWILGSAFLAWTYKYKNMAIATTIYILVNVGTLLLVSWIYYKEPVTTKQLIGVCLGIVAALLM